MFVLLNAYGVSETGPAVVKKSEVLVRGDAIVSVQPSHAPSFSGSVVALSNGTTFRVSETVAGIVWKLIEAGVIGKDESLPFNADPMPEREG